MKSDLLLNGFDPNHLASNASALESGKILFFPEYFYSHCPPALMSEAILDARHKNVSYDYIKNKLGAYKKEQIDLEEPLRQMMRGYAEFAIQLIEQALPSYVPHLQWGRTSFRPAEIKGRASSKRKDDTRLHVDSFAASPVNGLRILRVFCNINPHGEPRVWQVGEPFRQVLEQFAPRIPTYSKFTAHLLKMIKATKSLRSAYDHYMLHLHDTMKLDDRYQARVEKNQIDFPAQSSWIVFTDHVSHAALSGQYLLEQTFYLPVSKMAQPEFSPLYEWKKIKSELALA
ncbi:Kdo hydroxylase family protein [Legionella sp. km772]|uniref:Kdo hydroxylase family protein n=1 Tax=Legionella sp. km772 TaxID=2498111 RepID=UPI000F8EFEB1|nr:Kdo hydroxylase family protein [Legionella sp. km772]RUR10000.1 hypothetical protein ELY15_08575 [Legionella sp. km772]